MRNQLKAKFQCQEVTNFPTYDNELKSYVPGGDQKVRLTAVYAGINNIEDNQFSAATPSGEITMQVSASSAKDFIQPGKKYYVYFEECENQGQD
jgi:hypothetical protein